MQAYYNRNVRRPPCDPLVRLFPMTREEYWLLEVAVRFRPLVFSVHGCDREYLFYPIKSLGLTYQEAFEILSGFIQTDDILLSSSARGDFAPTEDELHVALRYIAPRERFAPDCDWYGLTQKGAARWEACAKPNWNRYHDLFDESEDHSGVDTLAFVSGSRDLTEWYVTEGAHVDGRSELVADSLVWNTISHWKATYWKTLPVGYQLRYKSRRILPEPAADTPEWHAARRRRIEAGQQVDDVLKWYSDHPDLNAA